ncbi:MAG: phytoene desaturase family protein, partial [Candidatus Binatia bacterium]
LWHRIGVGRPLGGMQRLADALAARLAELGGAIVTGLAVEEVLCDRKGTRGVRLADGRVIEARAVVATCDPRTAFHLVTPGAIERRWMARVDHAPANAAGAAPLVVDLALSGRVRFGRHRRPDGLDLRLPTLLIGTADEIRESFAASARGEPPAEPFLWAAVPSGCDPGQAPDGQDVVYLYPPAMPVAPRAGWDALRDDAVAATIRKAATCLEGLETLELGRWVATPDDLARRLNVTNGCVTHLDFGLLRSGPLRPAWGLGGRRPIVPGFFLGGAGTHPGGGVSGVPGKLAAMRAHEALAREAAV